MRFGQGTCECGALAACIMNFAIELHDLSFTFVLKKKQVALWMNIVIMLVVMELIAVTLIGLGDEWHCRF